MYERRSAMDQPLRAPAGPSACNEASIMLISEATRQWSRRPARDVRVASPPWPRPNSAE